MTNPYMHVEGADRPAPILVTCDHAGNTVPDDVGTLGVAPADMERHIAYDVGAAGVSLALAERLNAPAVLNYVSRLVIDPNRGADDPTLVMQLYDGTIIEGNRALSEDQITARREAYYDPYHAAYESLLSDRVDPIIVAIHSFTPQLSTRQPRPWHIGILHAGDTRISTPLIAELRKEPDLCVGENEPYDGHLPGDSIDQHALRQGRLNALIEIRNDLIETPEQQRAWADRLAPILTRVFDQIRG